MARRKQRKHITKLLTWITVVSACVFLLYILYLMFQSREDDFVEYNGFGVVLPPNYSIHGIDVSRYQDRISWDAVSQMQEQNVKIGFVIIKATEGTDLRDPFYKHNWKHSKKAGIVRGAYHFFRPAVSVQAQVRNFSKAVKLEPGDLPPVLDVEVTQGLKPKQLQAAVRSWLLAIESAYGVKPIIYTYASFYEQYLSRGFEGYPLWIAHYFQPDQPRISRPWSFWQHNDGGRVNGIVNKVDLNVFNGDSAAFRSLLVP